MALGTLAEAIAENFHQSRRTVAAQELQLQQKKEQLAKLEKTCDSLEAEIRGILRQNEQTASTIDTLSEDLDLCRMNAFRHEEHLNVLLQQNRAVEEEFQKKEEITQKDLRNTEELLQTQLTRFESLPKSEEFAKNEAEKTRLETLIRVLKIKEENISQGMAQLDTGHSPEGAKTFRDYCVALAENVLRLREEGTVTADSVPAEDENVEMNRLNDEMAAEMNRLNDEMATETNRLNVDGHAPFDENNTAVMEVEEDNEPRVNGKREEDDEMQCMADASESAEGRVDSALTANVHEVGEAVDDVEGSGLSNVLVQHRLTPPPSEAGFSDAEMTDIQPPVTAEGKEAPPLLNKAPPLLNKAPPLLSKVPVEAVKTAAKGVVSLPKSTPSGSSFKAGPSTAHSMYTMHTAHSMHTMHTAHSMHTMHSAHPVHGAHNAQFSAGSKTFKTAQPISKPTAVGGTRLVSPQLPGAGQGTKPFKMPLPPTEKVAPPPSALPPQNFFHQTSAPPLNSAFNLFDHSTGSVQSVQSTGPVHSVGSMSSMSSMSSVGSVQQGSGFVDFGGFFGQKTTTTSEAGSDDGSDVDLFGNPLTKQTSAGDAFKSGFHLDF